MEPTNDGRVGAKSLTSRIQKLLVVGFMLAGAGMVAQGQVSVTTQRYDIGRTGQDVNETILNPSDVNATQFGLLFSQPVDGFMYAEPLYLPNVTIGGQVHNVVFVATENDSVYAFDADTNGGVDASPLWFASMLSTAHGAAAGATTVSSEYVGTDIIPQVGITGTPVIDPGTGTLYVVSATMEGSSFFLRLHALDVTSGAEKFGGPVNITATVPGTGNGSSNGSLTFDPEWENQRPGLLLLNGIVYIGFASHGDGGPWHGWIFGYNAATLQQTGVFCTSPNGVGAGVWMSGAGLAADVLDPVNHPYGRMFIPTGNGDFTATVPYAAGMDYGDSVLNLDLTNGAPTIKDDFTPMNQANLDAFDGDLASGGLLIVPTQTTGSYPNLLVQAGKSGEVYLLDRDNLGGYNPSGDTVVQGLPYEVGDVGTWSMPAYWNGDVYYWAQQDTMKQFPLVNGQLTGPTETSSETYGYPGANPVISSNGSTEGIVWTVETDAYSSNGPAVLQAHSASNVSTTLYSSSTNPTRDNPGAAVKFVVPTVANGKVYVGSQTEVSVYGLLNGEPLAATPVFSPGAESFSGSVAVGISDTTPGATIYYTLDGTTPTAGSSIYTAPITIASSTTIQAIASASNYDLSAVASAAYVNSTQASTPVITPASGIYTQPVSVTITDGTTNASIYYTTNGTTPGTSSTLYTGAFTVSSSETVEAIAVVSGYSNSNVASASYTINTGQTGINFPVGFAGTQGIMILNGSSDLDDSRLQITNGALNEAGSAWYYQPINIQSFTTQFSFQLSNPAGNGITFAIQGDGTSALGNPASGLGYQGIANSIAVKFDFTTAVGNGTDSIGLYQNGVSPTVPAIDLSTSGINLASDDPMTVQLAYNGTILSFTITDPVNGAAYSTSWPVNIPSIVGGNTAYVGFTGGTGSGSSSQKLLNWVYTLGSTALPVSTSPLFTPPGGTYNTTQSVTVSNLSSGSTIYYTTNGTTPTTSSPVYSGPIAVSASQTLEAFAVTSGYSPSVVGTAVYTIAPSLPAPTFTPTPGNYTTPQTVSISDATGGTTIYYTTNGTKPTTSSNPYTGPFTVSSPQTIEAIAVESGYTNSPVGTATYTVLPILPAPTFSPAGGTYTSAQNVTIGDATSGVSIYYTTNGTTPTTSSTLYTGPITVSWPQTIQAIAAGANYTTSATASATYTINLGGTSYVNYPTDGFTATNLSLQGYVSVTGGLLQLTNGNTGEESAAWFNTKVPVGSFITDFTFQQLNATADGMTFAIQNDNIWAIGDAGSGEGYQGIPDSVAVKFDLYNSSGQGSDSTGLYTNGAAPTVPATDLSSTGVNLHSGDVMHAHIVYDGTNFTLTLTDTVTNATVTEVYPVNIPSIVGSSNAWIGFTGGTGSQTSTQDVMSWSYESPAPTAAAPTFSPAAGTYPTTQTVTISDTTPGATIYYTSNGSTPTTSSSVYSAPITVSASETVEAIAVESEFLNSPVTSAVYTISALSPTPAVMSTPTPGSTLTGTAATFTWSAGTGVAQYDIYVGTTGVGSSNIKLSGALTTLTYSVSGIPLNGGTLYVRLLSLINGAWQHNDYTYTEATATPAVISSPALGSTLPGNSSTFTWTAGIGVTQYDLYVGTTGVGSSNIVYSGAQTALSYNVSSIPTVSGTLYVRLLSLINGVWQHNDYTYTESPPVTPHITWSTPAAITYGTALSAAQLDATSTVAGTFVYTPALGVVPLAGNQTLSVTFTPTDSTDYTTATGTVTLVVNQAAPSITWATPAAITYGTALTATQLDATSSVAGAFAYTPALGTVLTAGNQTLSAIFTPTDTTDYATETNTVTLTVNQATPAISWATPAAITYGTALSATQLDATSTVAGSFVYTPALTTLLKAGNQTLNVTFTPTDTTDYTTAASSVTLVVNQATPAITWATPAAIMYGTALSATQLDATSTVAGTFVYAPVLGTVPNAGGQMLSVTLTPTDTTDYAAANSTVTLMVDQPAVLSSPAPGSTLTSSAATFAWTAGSGVTQYDLYVGTTGVGSSNIAGSGEQSALSFNVTGIPTTGGTLYVRLMSLINGVWQHNDYTYTEVTAAPAVMSTPAPGSTLAGSSATFTWTAGADVSQYDLYVGTTGVGSSNIVSSGGQAALSYSVSGIPAAGGTLYVRLLSLINGVWQHNDYTYTEVTALPAVMSTPAPGATLTGSAATFTWTSGTDVTQYDLYVGTTGVGSSNIKVSGSLTALTYSVSGIPTTGGTLYVRLLSLINGVWQHNDYTYIEQ